MKVMLFAFHFEHFKKPEISGNNNFNTFKDIMLSSLERFDNNLLFYLTMVKSKHKPSISLPIRHQGIYFINYFCL